jgi:GH25 family lysozyme M1 (1,4-beta-N-acetylmuramidase)
MASMFSYLAEGPAESAAQALAGESLVVGGGRPSGGRRHQIGPAEVHFDEGQLHGAKATLSSGGAHAAEGEGEVAPALANIVGPALTGKSGGDMERTDSAGGGKTGAGGGKGEGQKGLDISKWQSTQVWAAEILVGKLKYSGAGGLKDRALSGELVSPPHGVMERRDKPPARQAAQGAAPAAAQGADGIPKTPQEIIANLTVANFKRWILEHPECFPFFKPWEEGQYWFFDPRHAASWRDDGYTHAVVGTQDLGCMAAQLKALIEAGFTVDVYVFVTWTQAIAQVEAALDAIQGLPIRTLWLDVEDKESLGTTTAKTRVKELKAAVQRVKQWKDPRRPKGLGPLKVGIYTSEACWKDLTDNSTEFSDLPLWYARYEGTNNTTTSDFVGFGGWTEDDVVAKQWTEKGRAGDYEKNLDLDVFWST